MSSRPLDSLCFNLGILGALALREMVPNSKKKNLAMTKLSVNTTLARGIGFEMIFSFIYALVFFVSTNSRLTFKGFGGPLAIGLFYGVSHVITVKVFRISFFWEHFLLCFNSIA